MQKIAKIRWASITTIFILGFFLASVGVFFAPAKPALAAAAKWNKDGSIAYGGKTYVAAIVQLGLSATGGDTYVRKAVANSLPSGAVSFVPPNCPAEVISIADPQSSTSLTVLTELQADLTIYGCEYNKTASVNISNSDAAPDEQTNPTDDLLEGLAEQSDEEGVDPDASETNQDLCDTTLFNPLTWVLCPTIDLIHKGTDVMQKMINHLMIVDATGIFDRSKASGQSYYTAWNSFRVFGIALLLIAGLIMVVSQALGFEIIDAYTVKRILPRLIVAVIGISLSWWLMWFLVNLTNDLGIGIRRLIYTPFQGLISQTGDTGLQNLGSTLIGNLAVGGALLFLQWGGILSLLATVGLAVLIAFVVLILRQVVITFLILLAPLAIACYVLPNTEKAYKLWWDSLSKGLMMFPIISAFIAAGAVFSVVASSNQSSDFGLSSVIATLAYFLPYFALPFTFRLAGGAIATLGGLANDRSRGAFDRLRNYRGAKSADSWQRIKENRRFNPNAGGIRGRINRRTNNWLSNASDPIAASKYYGGNALRKAGFETSVGKGVADQLDLARFQATQKATEHLMSKPFNDRALRAVMGMDEVSAKSLREKAAQLSRSDDVQERKAADQLNSFATSLATDLFKDPEMGRAHIQAAAGMALAQHGFADPDDIAQLANRVGAGTLGGATQSGLANAVVTQSELLAQRAGRSDFKPGYSVRKGRDGTFEGTTSVISREDIGDKRTAVDKGVNRDGSIDPQAQRLAQEELGRAQAAQVERIRGLTSAEYNGKPQTLQGLEAGFAEILSTPDSAFDANGVIEKTFTDDRGLPQKYTFRRSDKERIIAQLANMKSMYGQSSPDHITAIDKILTRAGDPNVTAAVNQRAHAVEDHQGAHVNHPEEEGH